METSLHAPPAAWTQALDRHQLRRGQGIPTLSVLVGDPADAVALWREWAGASGYAVAVENISQCNAEHVGSDDYSPRTARLTVIPGSPDDPPGQRVDVLHAAMIQWCADLEKPGSVPWTVALALAVQPADAQTYLRDAPDCRARAFFREGLIWLNPMLSGVAVAGSSDARAETDPVEVSDGSEPIPLGVEESGTAERAAGSSAFFKEFAKTHSMLAQQRASAQTLASFRAAASALREVKDTTGSPTAKINQEKAATANLARSAAEQFLHDLLGDLPETAGLFELNVKLGFSFGVKPAEVDLLAAGLQLALEIDGYHHFRDLDNYRRDRRKDALLQKHGYLVLRFLAEDVVARLDEILGEIRAAVAFCRVTGHGAPPSPEEPAR